MRTTHRGIKDFRCDQCSKPFGHKDNLKEHKKTIHENTKTLDSKSAPNALYRNFIYKAI